MVMKTIYFSLRLLILEALFCTSIITSACSQGTAGKTSTGQSNMLREVIVSYADKASTLQLYRVNEDGSARRKITNSNNNCVMPAWSPDGKKLVYVQEGMSGLQLWLSDQYGMNPRLIMNSDIGLNRMPSWMPDSKHIVWMVSTPNSKTPEEKSTLMIMNTETLQFRQLFSDSVQTRFSNSMPVVSPDGTMVAFVSDRSGKYRIWVSNIDGTAARLISPMSAEVSTALQLPIEQKVPTWSPDGRWIAHWEGVEMVYLSNFTGKNDPQRDKDIARTWNVWVVGNDGNNKRIAGHGDDPTWSPDGFVTRTFSDQGGVYIMIESNNGWKELPIIPAQTLRFGRFTWKP